METPGAAGRARLVSAAAGCREPESERRDPVVPCPPSPVSVPGFALAALYPRASSVLVLCVSASVFPSVSLTPLFTVSPYLFLISLFCPLRRWSFLFSLNPSHQLSLSPSLSLDCLSLRSLIFISCSSLSSLPCLSIQYFYQSHLSPSLYLHSCLCLISLSLSILVPLGLSLLISVSPCPSVPSPFLCSYLPVIVSLSDPLSLSSISLCFLVLVTLFDLLSLYLSSVNTHFCLSGSVSLAFSTFLSISGKAIFLPFSLWPPCTSLNP